MVCKEQDKEGTIDQEKEKILAWVINRNYDTYPTGKQETTVICIDIDTENKIYKEKEKTKFQGIERTIDQEKEKNIDQDKVCAERNDSYISTKCLLAGNALLLLLLGLEIFVILKICGTDQEMCEINWAYPV